MKHHCIPSVVAALLVLNAAFFGSPRGTLPADLSAAEYDVYAVVIGNMFAGDTVTFDTQSKIKVLVIQDRTVSDHSQSIASEDNWQYVRQQFAGISQETISDYIAKNKESHQLKNSLNLKIKYALVEKEKVDQIFKGGLDGWEEFYKRFPDSGGFVSLSRVGFNPEMNQALVYVTHGCGGLCGSGHYVFLSKDDGGWKVSKRFMAWIS